MKETRFIAQNKEKWLESENLLNDPVKDPEKLSNLFTQVVDDLSYSRTYYPNRSVRVYLNKIAREYFSIIYSHQKEKKNTFKLFWLEELPQIIIYCKKPLIISLLIFLFAAGIGVFSSINDPQFTSSIMGEAYVQMTKENIAKGDPMGVYKDSGEVDMFLRITWNNLRVAFNAYILGLFLSIGTVALLLYNGIMVGCFQYFFIERGLFADSALTIWLHGTLEISSIIIAGGAGLTLGSGLIFPGTYSRLQAFQISAMRSLKLMLGISPIFVLAALIESFLTRYTDTPDIIRLLLILFSAFLIIGYFVVYPWRKSKKGFAHPLKEVKLQPAVNEPINYTRIKPSAEIIKDAFSFYQKYSSKLLRLITLVSLAMAIARFMAEDQIDIYRLTSEWWVYLFHELFYAPRTPSLPFIFVNAMGSAIILYRIFTLIDRESKNIEKARFDIMSLAQITIVMLMIYGTMYALGGWGSLLIILTFMLFLLLAFIPVAEKTNIFNSVSRTTALASASFGQILGIELIAILIAFSFTLISSAPLLYFNTEILEWNFAKTDVWSKNIIRFIEIFAKIFTFNLLLPIIASSAALLYYSLHEVSDAAHLKKAIEMIGTRFTKNNRR